MNDECLVKVTTDENPTVRSLKQGSIDGVNEEASDCLISGPAEVRWNIGTADEHLKFLEKQSISSISGGPLMIGSELTRPICECV